MQETPMRCYQVDPTQDSRWAELAERHPGASVFHSVAWLKALRRTYGYAPVAFTTSPPTGELKNGLVFCHVNSMFTGHRLVSLPFSDHCEPLFDLGEDVNFLILYLQAILKREGWKYLEVRPINVNFGQTDSGVGFVPAATYFLHKLDLRPELGNVFRSLDKNSVQRRAPRAQQSGLVEKRGTSDDLLKEFYRLLVITRRRHYVPPPPYSWFRTLIHCQGEALEMLLASRNPCVPHPKRLVYWRFPESAPSFDSLDGWKLKVAKRAFSHMPSGLLTITGNLLYRHLGQKPDLEE